MTDALVSRELERYVLGAAMLAPADVLDRYDDLQPTHFYDAGHQKLWRLLLKMADEGAEVDLRSVCEHVRHEESAYGGLAYVAGLSDDVPSSAVGWHVSRLRDLAHRRDVRARLRDALEAVEVPGSDVGEVLASVDSDSGAGKGALRDARTIVGQTLAEISAAQLAASEGRQTALPLPWPKLARRWGAKWSGGNGGLCIVAGRPGMGKTAAGLQMCAGVSGRDVDDRSGGTRPGHCAIFSLEMAATQCVGRIAAQRSGVNSQAVTRGQATPDEVHRYMCALEKLESERLWVDDTPDLTPSQICARIRRHIARHGPLDVVMIDYAELMNYRTGRTERLDLALGDAVKQLRNLSRELGFFVLLVWQLNRQCERRKPPIPLLSDLAESGQAERDADIVLLLYRDEYYHGDQTAEPGKVRLISAKFRGGETGVDVLDWEGECTAIRELDSRWEGRR